MSGFTSKNFVALNRNENTNTVVINFFTFEVSSTVAALNGRQTPTNLCKDMAAVIHTLTVCATVINAYMIGVAL